MKIDWDWTTYGLILLVSVFLIELTEFFNIGFVLGVSLIMIVKGLFANLRESRN